jgi:hypothetical protein
LGAVRESVSSGVAKGVQVEVLPGDAPDLRPWARAEMVDDREVFDDRARRHSTRGVVPPAAFERAHNRTTVNSRSTFPGEHQ